MDNRKTSHLTLASSLSLSCFRAVLSASSFSSLTFSCSSSSCNDTPNQRAPPSVVVSSRPVRSSAVSATILLVCHIRQRRSHANNLSVIYNLYIAIISLYAVTVYPDDLALRFVYTRINLRLECRNGPSNPQSF